MTDHLPEASPDQIAHAEMMLTLFTQAATLIYGATRDPHILDNSLELAQAQAAKWSPEMVGSIAEAFVNGQLVGWVFSEHIIEETQLAAAQRNLPAVAQS